jgi:hypothetical protein
MKIPGVIKDLRPGEQVIIYPHPAYEYLCIAAEVVQDGVKCSVDGILSQTQLETTVGGAEKLIGTEINRLLTILRGE